MNPCEGHSCDRCRLCRSGVCCLGRRRSREAELHARVLVTAWKRGPDPEHLDDCAGTRVSRLDPVLVGSLPTAEVGVVATHKP
jgi:hypothetical protein